MENRTFWKIPIIYIHHSSTYVDMMWYDITWHDMICWLMTDEYECVSH